MAEPRKPSRPTVTFGPATSLTRPTVTFEPDPEPEEETEDQRVARELEEAYDRIRNKRVRAQQEATTPFVSAVSPVLGGFMRLSPESTSLFTRGAMSEGALMAAEGGLRLSAKAAVDLSGIAREFLVPRRIAAIDNQLQGLQSQEQAILGVPTGPYGEGAQFGNVLTPEDEAALEVNRMQQAELSGERQSLLSDSALGGAADRSILLLPFSPFITLSDSALGDPADRVSKAREDIRRWLPVTRKFEQSLGGQIVQGVGQAFGTLPVWLIPGAGQVAGPAMSVAQIYQEGYDDALNNGATPDEAHAAAMSYIPASSLDILGDRLAIGRFLKPFVGKKIGKVILDITGRAFAEGATEPTQQAWLNYVASELAKYDPDRDFDEGLVDSFVVGAAVGLAINTAPAILGLNARTPEDAAALRAALAEVSRRNARAKVLEEGNKALEEGRADVVQKTGEAVTAQLQVDESVRQSLSPIGEMLTEAENIETIDDLESLQSKLYEKSKESTDRIRVQSIESENAAARLQETSAQLEEASTALTEASIELSEEQLSATQEAADQTVERIVERAAAVPERPTVTYEDVDETGTPIEPAMTDAVEVEIPPIPAGSTQIAIVSPDGTGQPAIFNGYYDLGNGDVRPSVARVVDGGWSHGMLQPGQKIVGDIPTFEEWVSQQAPQARPEKPDTTVGMGPSIAGTEPSAGQPGQIQPQQPQLQQQEVQDGLQETQGQGKETLQPVTGFASEQETPAAPSEPAAEQTEAVRPTVTFEDAAETEAAPVVETGPPVGPVAAAVQQPTVTFEDAAPVEPTDQVAGLSVEPTAETAPVAIAPIDEDVAIEQGLEAAGRSVDPELNRKFTQVMGRAEEILGRRSLSQAEIAESDALAKSVFDEAGIPVHFDDERGIWLMDDMTTPAEPQGRKLLAAVRREIGKSSMFTPLLRTLLNSIRVAAPDTIRSAEAFSVPLRNELYAAAQSQASFMGLSLGALASAKLSLTAIARNVPVYLHKMWSDAVNGEMIGRLIDKVTNELGESLTGSIESSMGDTDVGSEAVAKTRENGKTRSNEPSEAESQPVWQDYKDAIEEAVISATKPPGERTPRAPIELLSDNVQKIIADAVRLVVPQPAERTTGQDIEDLLRNPTRFREVAIDVRAALQGELERLEQAEAAGEDVSLLEVASTEAALEHVTSFAAGESPLNNHISKLVREAFKSLETTPAKLLTKRGAEIRGQLSERIRAAVAPEFADTVELNAMAVIDRMVADVQDKAARREAIRDAREAFDDEGNAQRIIDRYDDAEARGPAVEKPKNAVRQAFDDHIKDDQGDQAFRDSLLALGVSETATNELVGIARREITRRNAEVKSTAQRELERLEKLHSGVTQWSLKKKDMVREAIQKQHREPVDDARFTDALVALGVDADLARRLAAIIRVDIGIRKRWRELAEVRRLASPRAPKPETTTGKTGGLRSLVDSILLASPAQQKDAAWRRRTAQAYFEANGIPADRAEQAAQLFDQKFQQLLAQAKESAAKRVERSMTQQERLAIGSRKEQRKLWQLINESVNSGVLNNGEVVAALAKNNGWPVPPQNQITQMAEWSQQVQDLMTPSEADVQAVMKRENLPEKQARGVAANYKEAANLPEITRIQRKMQARWSSWTRPLTIRNAEGWKSIRDAIGEAMSAATLAKIGFVTKQIIDVSSQFSHHFVYAPIATALEARARNKSLNRPDTFFSDLGAAYKQQVMAMMKNWSTTGTALAAGILQQGSIRDVEGIRSSVQLFERMLLRADDMEAAGDVKKAFVTRFITYLWSSGYAVSRSFDNVNANLLQEPELYSMAIDHAMSVEGTTEAEAREGANAIIGDIAAEMETAREIVLLMMDPAVLSKKRNKVQRLVFNNAFRVRVREVVMERQLQRAALAGMSIEETRQKLTFVKNLLGWNVREESGFGGGIGKAMKAFGTVLPSAGLFANAAATGINRGLQYMVGGIPGVNIIAGGRGPWYASLRERQKRKIENLSGLVISLAIAYGVAAGFIRIRTRAPEDKEDRDLFYRTKKINTIEFGFEDDDEKVVVSLTSGPFAHARIPLYVMGAWQDMLEERRIRNIRNRQRWAEKGMEVEDLPPLRADEMAAMTITGLAAGTLGGSRTFGGFMSSLTGNEARIPSMNRIVMSQLVPLIPGMPQYHEMKRAFGVRVDDREASFLEALFQMESSGEVKEDSFGQRPTPDFIINFVQTLTGGTYFAPIDTKKLEREFKQYRIATRLHYMPQMPSRHEFYEIDGEEKARQLTPEEWQKVKKLFQTNVYRYFAELDESQSDEDLLFYAKKAASFARADALADGAGANSLTIEDVDSYRSEIDQDVVNLRIKQARKMFYDMMEFDTREKRLAFLAEMDDAGKIPMWLNAETRTKEVAPSFKQEWQRLLDEQNQINP